VVPLDDGLGVRIADVDMEWGRSQISRGTTGFTKSSPRRTEPSSRATSSETRRSSSTAGSRNSRAL